MRESNAPSPPTVFFNSIGRLDIISRTRDMRLKVAKETADEFGSHLGVSGSTIHRWENPAERAHPSSRHFFLMCQRLDISANWVLFNIGPKVLSEII